MARRESEISAARRILHDAMKHLERAEHSQQSQQSVAGGYEEGTSIASSDDIQLQSQRAHRDEDDTNVRSLAIAAEQHRLFGQPGRSRDKPTRSTGVPKRKKPMRKKSSERPISCQVWSFTVFCLADNQRVTLASSPDVVLISVSG